MMKKNGGFRKLIGMGKGLAVWVEVLWVVVGAREKKGVTSVDGGGLVFGKRRGGREINFSFFFLSFSFFLFFFFFKKFW